MIVVLITVSSPRRNVRVPFNETYESHFFYSTKRTSTIFWQQETYWKESSILRFNASYCRVICSEKEAKLPTIGDFATTKNVIEYSSSPGESIRKRIEQVGNGFSEKMIR